MIRSLGGVIRTATACLGVVAATCTAVTAHAQQKFPLALVGLGAPDGERLFLHAQSLGECVMEFVCSSAGCWQHGCISGQQSAPALGSRMLTYYEPNARRDHLFFESGDQHIHEWSWPDTSGRASNVVDVDLTQQPGTSGVLAAGAYVSGFPGGALDVPATLTGFVDGSGVEHVFFTDDENSVDEFYHNSSAWWLGHEAQFGPVDARGGSGLTSMWDGTCQHIFYLDTSDALLFEDYACGGPWQAHPLTGTTGAITPKINTSNGPENHMVATFLAGNTEELWGMPSNLTGLAVAYCETTQCWGSGVLTTPELEQDSPVAMPSPGNPAYEGSEGDIFTPNDTSQRGQSLQSLYGNPTAVRTGDDNELSELAAFTDPSGTSHIFYVGAFGDVFEYYQPSGQNTWSTNQLTTEWEIQ
jgi:hypothetical protein